MSVSSPLQPGRSPTAVAPALLERHRGGLRAYLATLPGAEAARVEQVVAEVFEEAAAQAELEDDPAVWLFQAGRRRLLGGGRGGDIIGRGDEAAGEDTLVEGEDPRIAVHRAFERLTAKQQEVLRLKFQFGFGLDEIGRVTGVGRAGAGGLLHHAMERVGQAVRPAEAEGASLIRDSRLTAFAFDELDDAEKQAFVESAADGKRLLEQTEALRRAGQVLTQVLTSGAPVPKRRRRAAGGKRRGVLWGGLALLTLVGVLVWWLIARQPVEAAASAPSVRSGDERTQRSESDAARRRPDEPQAASRDLAGPARGERELKPGEADWERKAFGRGLAQGGGASGAAAGSPGGAVATGGAGGNPGSPGGAVGMGGRAAGATGPSGAAASPRDPARAPSSAAKPKPAESRAAQARSETPIVINVPGAVGAVGGGGGGGASAETTGEFGRGREAQAAGPVKRPSLKPVDLRPRLPQGAGARKEEVLLGDWMAAANVTIESPPAGAPDVPLRVRADLVRSPWQPDRHLLRVAVQGRSAPPPARRPANLVFVIDVSDSMAAPNRLALVQEGIRRLADRLIPEDHVAVVTYAATARLVLPSQVVGEKALELRNTLAGLQTAGRTNGSEGLRLGLDIARAAHVDGGANVVVLCTDGNFNLGDTEPAPLAALAGGAEKEGIKLSVFGFGRSDRNDLRLELLAAAGGGRSCYVNTRDEAERLLAGQVDGLFAAAAVDVEIKVAFDPERVASARRVDEPDTGTLDVKIPEVLPGRSAAAWYELEWREPPAGDGGAWAKLEAAYRRPGADAREQQAVTSPARPLAWSRTDDSLRHGAALVEFARILRADLARAAPELDRLETWVRANLPESGGYRMELLENIAAVRADGAAR